MSPTPERRRVVTIDCQYLRPRFAASYLLIDGDRAAFIDNNTIHSVPLLLQALEHEGLSPAQVDWVIVTHIHLDHAGGTSALMKACPQATCLAHPKAARHLIDPSKIIQGASAVYGREAFARMYGEIEPVASERVRAVEDHEKVALGSGDLEFLHTRGHANHHMCIWDPGTSSIFTGDSFGLFYPDLQPSNRPEAAGRGEKLFGFPSTSPTDFDYAEAVATLDRIAATGAQTAYPTHFGAIRDLNGARAQLREHLDFSKQLIDRAAPLSDDQLTPFFEKELHAHMESAAQARGLKLTAGDWELLKLDVDLNAQGLTSAVLRARRPSR